MFDWLSSIGHWLERYVIGLPIYYAAPAMIAIGALDSSLLSLPEINDYLVVGRCFKQPSAAFYFPLFAAIGSVIGCLILYTIMRRGGQALLRRRFKRENIERVERAYARYGFLAIAIPALLPPPMPFKIFRGHCGNSRVSTLEVFGDGNDRAVVSLLRGRYSGGVLRPARAVVS